MVRTNLDPELMFSNGTFVFNARHQQLSPKSQEGEAIEKVLQKQKNPREEKAVQKKRFEVITNKDGDGFIGDKPVTV